MKKLQPFARGVRLIFRFWATYPSGHYEQHEKVELAWNVLEFFCVLKIPFQRFWKSTNTIILAQGRPNFCDVLVSGKSF